MVKLGCWNLNFFFLLTRLGIPPSRYTAHSYLSAPRYLSTPARFPYVASFGVTGNYKLQQSIEFCPQTKASFHMGSSSAVRASKVDHIVDGVICREIHIEVPLIGTVTVLEATAESQESLVDMALAVDEDELAEDEQKLAAGDPYGAVLWPAAWAVANYTLTREKHLGTNKRPLEGLSVLELGTGTGLVSLAAALAGAKVIATDYEPLALSLTEYAAKSFHGRTRQQSSNKENNGENCSEYCSCFIEHPIQTEILDMCDYDNTPLPGGMDLVVAADIMYEPKTGVAMAHRAVEALHLGSRVIVGDSPGRPGRPAFLKTLESLGIKGATFVDTIGRTCSGPRHELICGKGSTSVSETPQNLPVAIMELDPSMLP